MASTDVPNATPTATTPESTATVSAPEPSALNRVLGTLGWALGQGPRLLRNNLAALSPEALRRFVTAPSWAVRAQLLATPLVVDPRVLQQLTRAASDGVFVAGSGALAVVGRFDDFIRASTLLRSRGERTNELFSRSSRGSTFTADPRAYGRCPFGVWEERAPVEPHVTCRAVYPAQVADIERLVDEYLTPRIGSVVEVGELLRTLVWDVMVFTSYGVDPCDETHRVLAAFEAHTEEFDRSLRVRDGELAPAWSEQLKSLVKEIGDWTWATTTARQTELEAESDDMTAARVDVLSYALHNFPPPDLRKFDGALNAMFTAGFNNAHCAVTGAVLANALQDDGVAAFVAEDVEPRIEHVVRETLRLHTAIPIGRVVQPEDAELSLGGTALQKGGSVLLPTVAVNTDPTAWDSPDAFDPARFAGRDDVAYMCGNGFAPFGAAAELGGRQCSGRFYIVHLLTVVLRKLLCDYKISKVGKGFFDYKEMIGSSQYCGHCKVRVEKR